MKQKIVIKFSSVLSYEPVIQRAAIPEAGRSRFAPARLRLTPVSVEDLNVQPESLMGPRRNAAGTAFDMMLSSLRGDKMAHLWCSSQAAKTSGSHRGEHRFARTTRGDAGPGSAPRVDSPA